MHIAFIEEYIQRDWAYLHPLDGAVPLLLFRRSGRLQDAGFPVISVF
jgi:hypothetical protein